MIAVREFKTVDEMLAFQKALKARLYKAPPPRVVSIPPRPAPVAPLVDLEKCVPVAKRATPVSFQANHNAHVIEYRHGRGEFVRTGKEIQRATAYKYGLPLEDMLGPRRFTLQVMARAEACWIMRHRLNWPLLRIASIMGRDHTTVLNAIKYHNKRMAKEDPDLFHFRTRTEHRGKDMYVNQTISVAMVAEVNRLSHSGLPDMQISMELGLRPSHIRWAISCRLGGKK